MSNKYPCVYYDNGKCQKFSDEKYNSWCDFDQCEFQTPSNGDRIRAMSDEELAVFLHTSFSCYGCPARIVCESADLDCDDIVFDWIKQPYKEAT